MKRVRPIESTRANLPSERLERLPPFIGFSAVKNDHVINEWIALHKGHKLRGDKHCDVRSGVRGLEGL
jgi:hypothetical protein